MSVDCVVIYGNASRTERTDYDTPPYDEYFGCPVCGGAYEESMEEEEDIE